VAYLGRCFVFLSFLLLAPSIVPGAISVLAVYLSLFILMLCITTIKFHGSKYFKLTLRVTGLGIFLLSDCFRLYGNDSGIGWTEKLFFYAIYCIIVLFGHYKIKRHTALKKMKN
jgi:heme O synthase-like polyprenyltransferase